MIDGYMLHRELLTASGVLPLIADKTLAASNTGTSRSIKSLGGVEHTSMRVFRVLYLSRSSSRIGVSTPEPPSL